MGIDGAGDLLAPVFGNRTRRERDSLIAEFCSEFVGSTPARDIFWHESIGVVAGYELADGRQVAVKIFQPDITSDFLVGVEGIRRALFEAGFPCAEPLVGPHPIGEGLATVERFVQCEAPIDPTGDAAISSSAQALAFLISLSPSLEPRDLAALDTGGPWRTDFSPEGWDLAEDLDFLREPVAVAQRLFMPAASLDTTVGHSDWRMANMGFDPSDNVVAVFDWDSLHYRQECWTVGVAASMCTSGAGNQNKERPPILATSARFIGEYERARGRGFTDVERQGVVGALLYNLCGYAEVQAGELRQPVGERREWLASGRYMETIRNEWKSYVALVS